MTAADLIKDLRQRGLRLRPNGDKLRIEGPARLLTADLRERLTEAKADILAALKREAVPGACSCCGSTRWWLSIHHAIVCPTCHPAAHPSLIAEWLDGGTPG
jgi:hypothetical protein